jgi:hypothetical protein
VPIADIQKLLIAKGVKEKVLINDHSLLPRNACAAPKCKFFLTPVKYIAHHFHASKDDFPKHFHATIRQNYLKTEEQIFAILEQVEGGKGSPVWCDHFGRSQLDTLAYIRKVKKVYRNMLG